MAAIHGKNGTVFFDTIEAGTVTAWSVEATAATAESTVMENANGAKTYVAGFLSWTAKVDVFIDGLDWTLASESGKSAALALHADLHGTSAAKKYTGTAILMSMEFSLDSEGVGTITHNFQGDGTLTEATDNV